MPAASLTLTLTTVKKAALDGTVRIDLTPVDNSSGGQHVRTAEFALNGATVCVVRGIAALDIGTPYRLGLETENYQTVSFFTRIVPGNQAVARSVFLVNPSKVSGIDAPPFERLEIPGLRAVLDRSEIPQMQENGAFLQGQRLYDKLSPMQKACLLNVSSKASHWTAAAIWPQVRSIVRIEQDRFFARVDEGLLDFLHSAEGRQRFVGAGKSLHTPMPNFELVTSFKSIGTHATLQVTLMKRGDQWAADLDIDEDAGFGHTFEVLRNGATGGLTNPYQVHELLLLGEPNDSAGETSVDAGYKLLLA